MATHMNWNLGMQKGMILETKTLENCSKDSQAGTLQRTLNQGENREKIPRQPPLICKHMSS